MSNNYKRLKPGSRQEGFTIVEILIATVILSTILVLVTIMITGIGSLYQKGVNQARVQDAVRTITDDVSQHLQLTSGNWQADGTVNNGAFCLGNTRYSFVIGKQIGTQPGQSRHVLWRETIPLATDCHQADLSLAVPINTTQPGSGGTELIPPNSRLIKFDVSGTSPYIFNLTIAYGDDDLLCSPSDPLTCSAADKAMRVTGVGGYDNFLNRDIVCKGRAGDQFCATAKAETAVVQRL